jgi:hypothetical protein
MTFSSSQEEPSLEKLLLTHASQGNKEEAPAASGDEGAEGDDNSGKPKKPRFLFRNNHIRAAGRKRDRTESEALVRKRVSLFSPPPPTFPLAVYPTGLKVAKRHRIAYLHLKICACQP